MRLLPRKWALFFGRILGWIIYYCIPRRHEVALQNLRIAFPELSEFEQKCILKRTSCHFGMVLIDFLRMPKLNKDNIDQVVTITHETEKLLDSERGGIIMTGHMGNWELILPVLGINGYPFVVVTKTQRNKGGQQFFDWVRTFPNVELIPKERSRVRMFRSLSEKKFLGLASDQNAGESGINISFFNKPASIPKGAAKFHLKTGVPILVGFCILSEDYQYSLSLKSLDTNNLDEDEGEAIKQINTRFSNLLEDAIRQNPEQYFWYHRRWPKKNYA